MPIPRRQKRFGRHEWPRGGQRGAINENPWTRGGAPSVTGHASPSADMKADCTSAKREKPARMSCFTASGARAPA